MGMSDIWRSYFAQRLFWDTGLQVGIMICPLVVQDRNPHYHSGDLEAERDLRMKSGQLVEFLGSWLSSWAAGQGMEDTGGLDGRTMDCTL